MFSSVQQCGEWRGFQGQRYIEHACEFGRERTKDTRGG
jgi:hypothetical protein